MTGRSEFFHLTELEAFIDYGESVARGVEGEHMLRHIEGIVELATPALPHDSALTVQAAAIGSAVTFESLDDSL